MGRREVGGGCRKQKIVFVFNWGWEENGDDEWPFFSVGLPRILMDLNNNVNC